MDIINRIRKWTGRRPAAIYASHTAPAVAVDGGVANTGVCIVQPPGAQGATAGRVAVYEVVDGHDERIALVWDKALAAELASAAWGGMVRPTAVDDAAARRLLETLRG